MHLDNLIIPYMIATYLKSANVLAGIMGYGSLHISLHYGVIYPGMTYIKVIIAYVSIYQM